MEVTMGRFVLDPEDACYPDIISEGCRTIARGSACTAAPRIYGIGDASALLGPCVTIIGARNATPYGLEVAYKAGKLAAESGVCVVSGGAAGCDAEASRGALDAGGRTVIVSGCGADCVYPSSSDDIFAAARKGEGCVISMEDWGTAPRRYTFSNRNVLLAAISKDVLVCEAPLRSGTVGIAEMAMEMERAVYAVPGSIFSPASQGTNFLIQGGCKMIVDESGLELMLGNAGIPKVLF